MGKFVLLMLLILTHAVNTIMSGHHDMIQLNGLVSQRTESLRNEALNTKMNADKQHLTYQIIVHCIALSLQCTPPRCDSWIMSQFT